MKALVMIALLLAGTVTRADEPADKAEARALLGEGNRLYSTGDFAGALDRFRRAYESFPSPKLLVNVAACERLLGHLERAANDLDEYLVRFAELTPPSDEESKLAVQARADLDTWRKKLGRIEVAQSPTGASLEVDAMPGALGRWVQPGTHHVALRAPGRPPLDREVSLARGDTITLALPQSPTAAPVVVEKAVSIEPAPDKRRRWVLPVAIVGGVVVVGLAVGLGVGLGVHHPTEALHGSAGTVTFQP